MKRRVTPKRKTSETAARTRNVLLISLLAVFFLIYMAALFLLWNSLQVEARGFLGRVICFVAALVGSLISFGILRSTGKFSRRHNVLGGAAAGTAIFFLLLVYDPRAQETIRFSGVVKSSVSGTPVADVQVWIDNVPAYPAVTNDIGHFEAIVPRVQLGSSLSVNLLHRRKGWHREQPLPVAMISACRLEVPEDWCRAEESADVNEATTPPKRSEPPATVVVEVTKFRLVFARFAREGPAKDYAEILGNNGIAARVSSGGRGDKSYSVISADEAPYQEMVSRKSRIASAYGVYATIEESRRP